MLTLTGTLLNTYVQPKGLRDGKETGGQDKIQLIGEIELPDGGSRMDMITLTTHDIRKFESLIQQRISIPIGVFASGKSLVYFIPKGSSPTPLN
jgi:hypothetical protein